MKKMKQNTIAFAERPTMHITRLKFTQIVLFKKHFEFTNYIQWLNIRDTNRSLIVQTSNSLTIIALLHLIDSSFVLLHNLFTFRLHTDAHRQPWQRQWAKRPAESSNWTLKTSLPFRRQSPKNFVTKYEFSRRPDPMVEFQFCTFYGLFDQKSNNRM